MNFFEKNFLNVEKINIRKYVVSIGIPKKEGWMMTLNGSGIKAERCYLPAWQRAFSQLKI
jgi:hypothetical protein